MQWLYLLQKKQKLDQILIYLTFEDIVPLA